MGFLRQKENDNLSCHMGKPTICICENKDADQLRGNREADQRLCFRYTDSTIPPLLKQNFKLLACFCSCTGRFVSDLFGNHIVAFPTRWLIYLQIFVDFYAVERNAIFTQGILSTVSPKFLLPMRKVKFSICYKY